MERVAVNTCQPLHHLIELLHHLFVVEVFAGDGREEGRNLLAVHFVDTTVDGIEQALRQVGTRAEELHLLTDAHGRHAASDTVVVAVVGTHEVVVFVLDGRRSDRHLRAITLPVFGQTSRPEHREVGFGSRSEIGERVEDAVAGFRHHRAAVHAHTADRFGHPNGVAGEERVVFGSAEEAHNAELHHELVNEFLCFHFRELTGAEIAFDVDVEEGRNTADRHGSTVLILDGCEVSEVNILHCFARIFCGTRKVETVSFTEFYEVFQRIDLLCGLFAELDRLVIHLLNLQTSQELLLVLDEVVHAIESHAAIVTDDTTTAVSVGQTGDDVTVAAAANVGRVGRENAFVVRLAIFGEDLLRPVVELITISVERIFHHAHTAFGEDTAFERSVRLQTDNDLFVLVDVARTIGGYTLRESRFDVVESFLAFHFEHLAELVPKREGVFGGRSQEAVVALIRGVVELDEVANVDFIFPNVSVEAAGDVGQLHSSVFIEDE